MTSHAKFRKIYQLPAVVRANTDVEIAVRPLFEHSRFSGKSSYAVRHAALEQQPDGYLGTERTVRPGGDGVLRFSLRFAAEQEHALMIDRMEGKAKIGVAAFRIYSLEEDLYRRRPRKGDLHMHSFRSDGREDPACMAAICRRAGLDFMAVTDHNRYSPSLEAKEAFDDVTIDLGIFPGEEMHPPDNPIHILNFGGESSVVELFRQNVDRYRAEVAVIQDDLPDLPPGVDAYQYASCLWSFRKIREVGGLAVFCHPYWFFDNRFVAPGPLTEHLLREKPFDAMEVVTSLNFSHTRDNLMENTYHTARFYEEIGRIPPIGVSDAHKAEGIDEFGRCFTIVFPPSLDREAVVESIRDGYSVAVEDLPGLGMRPHGSFRLVKYAHFLLREVFPTHDELCQEEGRLMLDYLKGSEGAKERLAGLSGRTADHLEQLWA
jgi:hypothetical protein